MADTEVEVRKGPPERVASPDLWRASTREMDRLFDRFAGGFGFPWLRRMFDIEPWQPWQAVSGLAAPAVEISEDEKTYKITAELPGLDAKDIDVSMSDHRLVLKGEKRAEKEEKNKNYHLSERCYGAFQRSFPLPDGIDREKVAADFAKGVLTVTLPKTVEAQKQTRKIEVKAS
jgi:HSP20 family protein